MSTSASRMRLGTAGMQVALVFALLLSVVWLPAAAVPLDPEECRKLWAEHKELVGTGIEAKLVKGPDWALANLSAEEIDDIKHFLLLEEQLQFRCPLIQSSEPQSAAGPGMPLPQRRPEPPAKAGKSAGAKAGPAR